MFSLQRILSGPVYPLFSTLPDAPHLALLANGRLQFSHPALAAYEIIKNEPHLYWAYGEDPFRPYVGVSNQPNGRWRPSTAYHFGDLTNAIVRGTRRHQEWASVWFTGAPKMVGPAQVVELKVPVFIAFRHVDEFRPSNSNCWPVDLALPPAYGVNVEREPMDAWLKDVEKRTMHLDADVQWLNIQNAPWRRKLAKSQGKRFSKPTD